jgi:transglutaminase-like putative cysteine protease
MARQASIKPIVRTVTARVVVGVPGSAAMLQARLIRDWITERVRFLPDPATAEALHEPDWSIHQILTAGQVQLDCDDVAMLAAAMGQSIGLRARFVAVAFLSPNSPYQHVWADLGQRDAWLTVDPTRPVQGLAGLAISRSTSVEV